MKKTLIALFALAFAFAFGAAQAAKHEMPAKAPAKTEAKKADPIAKACKDMKPGTMVKVDGKDVKCPEPKKDVKKKEVKKKDAKKDGRRARPRRPRPSRLSPRRRTTRPRSKPRLSRCSPKRPEWGALFFYDRSTPKVKSEQIRPWLVQTRKAKSVIFALLHSSNTYVFEECPAFWPDGNL